MFFVPGYWLPETISNPKLSLEDFIFSFSVGGIIAVLYTGLIFGLLYFLFFSIFTLIFPSFIRHWNLSGLSGIVILGVPLEEIIWAVGAGGLVGPIYEYLLSIKLTEKQLPT